MMQLRNGIRRGCCEWTKQKEITKECPHPPMISQRATRLEIPSQMKRHLVRRNLGAELSLRGVAQSYFWVPSEI